MEPFKTQLDLHRSIVLSTNDKKAFGKAGIAPKSQLRARGSVLSRQIPAMERSRIDVLVSYPDRIARDAQNYQATMKPIIDGMVHPDLHDRHNPNKGYMIDDNDLYLEGPFILWSGRLANRSEQGFYTFAITITPLGPWKPPT